MSLTVNTNMQALRIQQNLNKATSRMETSMERMSSGSKINSAKDDAAGLGVATTLMTTIGASKIASSNVAIGNTLLATAEGTMKVATSNLQRVRDLVEQAANGTYSSSDRTAIKAEVDARLTQITSLGTAAKFNGTALFAGTDIVLQTGTDSSGTLVISGATVLKSVDVSLLLSSVDNAFALGSNAGLTPMLASIDAVITAMTTRQTKVGALQNQLGAISDGLQVQQTNLASALSTIKDADVAAESASFVQNQILQQASASLLVQANSAPQIALTLIRG